MAINTTPLAEASVYPAQIFGPLPNSDVESSDVDNGLEKLGNRTRYLTDTKVNRAGDTMTGLLTANAGITVASGQDLTLNGAAIVGDVSTATLGMVRLNGRKKLLRARNTLADANATVYVLNYDRYTLPVNPAAPRTITLGSVATVPIDGETMAFFWQPGTTAVGAGTQYTFKNEAAVTLLKFDGSAVVDTGLVWAEFEYVAGAWAIGKTSSTLHDGSAYYGAIKP